MPEWVCVDCYAGQGVGPDSVRHRSRTVIIITGDQFVDPGYLRTIISFSTPSTKSGTGCMYGCEIFKFRARDRVVYSNMHFWPRLGMRLQPQEGQQSPPSMYAMHCRHAVPGGQRFVPLPVVIVLAGDPDTVELIHKQCIPFSPVAFGVSAAGGDVAH